MKVNKIIIRADGNAEIGVGHLMRCLTIADGVQTAEQVHFVCAEEASAELVREKGYCATVLGSNYQDMEAELPLWDGLIGKISEDTEHGDAPLVVLVDSYYVTPRYLEYLRRFGKVVLLDDMMEVSWKVEVVVNYNVFATEAMYNKLENPYPAKVYAGGKYIPVRSDFCGRNYVVRPLVENVLITTGGGDVENIAGQILEVIYEKDCHYHLVTGRFNAYYEQLLALAQKYTNIHVYHNVQDMAGLMEKCDLAVTAGGTTVYELSAVGVPFVCFSYAQNQEKLTEFVGKEQKAGYAGAYHKNAQQTLQEIASQIQELKCDHERRLKYHRAEKELVDGLGAVRIARILQGTDL